MLRLIKITHTLIWAIMAVADFYILYAAITKTYDFWLWIALGLMALEVTILLMNKMQCPFTEVAKKYSDNVTEGSDIYLPKWFARYNKITFGTLLIIGLIMLAFGYLS